MKSTEKVQWLNACIELGRNPYKKIKCPSCSNEFLEVGDISMKEHHMRDRHVFCRKCSKMQIISRMSIKGPSIPFGSVQQDE